MEPHPGWGRTDRALFRRIRRYHWVTEGWLEEAVLRLLVSQVRAECGDTECSGAELSWPNMLGWVGGYCWKLMPSVHESHQRLLDVWSTCGCATWGCTRTQSGAGGATVTEKRETRSEHWDTPPTVKIPSWGQVIQEMQLLTDTV